jgi:uncharacterized membrane protein YjfL (UPF0719 family)
MILSYLFIPFMILVIIAPLGTGRVVRYASWVATPFFRIRFRYRAGAITRRTLVVLLPFGCVLGAASTSLGLWPTALRYGESLRCGAAAVAFMAVFAIFPVFGISAHNDAVERDNPAAAIAFCGAALGAVPAVSGIVSGVETAQQGSFHFWGEALLTLLAAWLVLEIATSISDAITIDRDAGAGLRLAAFLVGTAGSTAYALARLRAGQSIQTSPGFAFLPPLPLLIAAIFVERRMRPPVYPLSPVRSLPAVALYLALGAGGAGGTAFLQ